MSNYKILNSRNIFIITLIVISLTIISVWIFGFGNHRSLFENSLLSTTILSLAFFLFISIGLYNGVKIKDNLGEITDRFDHKKIDFLKNSLMEGDCSSVAESSDSILGIIVSLILWFIVAFIISYLLWAFGAVLWISILTFTAMLYWIFFRAMRLVLKKSSKCRGNFINSALYGFSFTILYNFWIYAIIFMTHQIL
ncbi:hypothetical protein Q1W71_00290 [Flavobacterium pectinovorum]|uniref:hypothetical protein n=1 Tax=Flavobacterium pectinovorum TaxID=29533 RepID=UPI00265ED517|nr:hypothetical protein [Flavobacterium pectinovorum]WKL48223.1 hypothetical protein Q1W71_00290 [Flavobacterium pectinovorum]